MGFVGVAVVVVIGPQIANESAPNLGRSTVSPSGERDLPEGHNSLAAEKPLQRISEIISDKPEKTVQYENALNPNE